MTTFGGYISSSRLASGSTGQQRVINQGVINHAPTAGGYDHFRGIHFIITPCERLDGPAGA